MRFLILTPLICTFLAGCAASVIASNPRSVTVKAGTTKAAEAQALADAECAKHGRFARLTIPPGGQQPMNYVYACVE